MSWRNITAGFLALGIVGLLCSLGFWQLHRAELATVRLQQQAEALTQPPASIQALQDHINQHKNIQGYPILLEGYFLPENIFLLDNRMYQGRVGYHVLQAFKDRSIDQAIIVNRGWIAGDADRTKLPTIHTPTHAVRLSGTVYLPPKQPFLLKQDSFDPASSRWRVQAIQLELWQDWLHKPLINFVVELDQTSSQNYGYVSHTTIINNISPERHRAYAWQWFSLSIAFVVLCALYKRHSRKHAHNPHSTS